MNVKTIIAVVGAVVGIGGVVTLAISNIKNLNKIKKLQEERSQLICENVVYKVENIVNAVKNYNEKDQKDETK